MAVAVPARANRGQGHKGPPASRPHAFGARRSRRRKAACAGAAPAAGLPQATPPSCGNSSIRVPDAESHLCAARCPEAAGEHTSCVDREVPIPPSSGSVRQGREAPARGTCPVPGVFSRAQAQAGGTSGRGGRASTPRVSHLPGPQSRVCGDDSSGLKLPTNPAGFGPWLPLPSPGVFPGTLCHERATRPNPWAVTPGGFVHGGFRCQRGHRCTLGSAEVERRPAALPEGLGLLGNGARGQHGGLQKSAMLSLCLIWALRQRCPCV